MRINSRYRDRQSAVIALVASLLLPQLVFDGWNARGDDNELFSMGDNGNSLVRGADGALLIRAELAVDSDQLLHTIVRHTLSDNAIRCHVRHTRDERLVSRAVNHDNIDSVITSGNDNIVMVITLVRLLSAISSPNAALRSSLLSLSCCSNNDDDGNGSNKCCVVLSASCEPTVTVNPI